MLNFSSVAGIFTAPVRGAYYFRFTGMEVRHSFPLGIKLYHNDKVIARCYDRNDDVGYVNVSNAFVLQLEKGDVVYMVLKENHGIFDDYNNRTTFSGFLLFAL